MPTPVMRTTQILTLSFMSIVVGLGVVVALSVPEADLTLPPILVIAGQVVAGIVMFLVISMIGFNTGPIALGTEPEQAKREALGKHQTSILLRLALSEAIALGSIAVAFILTEGQLLAYVIGAVISLALMAWFAYPSARNIRRVESALDASGVRSGLAETFGLDNGTAGTHQIL